MDYEALRRQVWELYNKLRDVYFEYYQLWKSEMFLTWRWWISLAIVVVPWTVWIILRKKGSTYRLLFAGFFVLIVSSFLDMLGIALRLWIYPVDLLPLMPSYIPFDFSALPVVTMLFIQYLPKVKPVFKALAFAALGSFVFQPLMIWVGLYCECVWKNWYSFPILFLIYLGANFFATRTRFEKV